MLVTERATGQTDARGSPSGIVKSDKARNSTAVITSSDVAIPSQLTRKPAFLKHAHASQPRLHLGIRSRARRGADAKQGRYIAKRWCSSCQRAIDDRGACQQCREQRRPQSARARRQADRRHKKKEMEVGRRPHMGQVRIAPPIPPRAVTSATVQAVIGPGRATALVLAFPSDLPATLQHRCDPRRPRPP